MFDRQQVQAAFLELVRERNVRRKYYPRAIAERKLSEREAKRRMDALETAITILSKLAQTGIVQTDGQPIPSSASNLLGEVRPMEWLCLKPSNAPFALFVRRCDYDFFLALLSDSVQVGPAIPTTEHDRHFADVDGNRYRAVELIPIVIAKLDNQGEGKEGSAWLSEPTSESLN